MGNTPMTATDPTGLIGSSGSIPLMVDESWPGGDCTLDGIATDCSWLTHGLKDGTTEVCGPGCGPYGDYIVGDNDGSGDVTVDTGKAATVRMPLPPDAQACSTNTGVNFNAPPGFSVSNIAANGQTDGLAGAGAAVGQGGYYDFQRFQVGSTTLFFPGYTPVANVAVGAYLQGAGVPQWMSSAISNTYAFFKSSNGATAQQAKFRNLGFSLASGKGTYSCHPQIP